MEYSSGYSQPFTLEEAISFDLSVIVEEIARLEISLKHLRSTQEILQSCLLDTQEPDIEFSRAYEENKAVISSQEERISILKTALTEKGIRLGVHYDARGTSTSGMSQSTQVGVAETTNSEGSGVYL